MTEQRFIRIKNENGISIKDTKTGYERYYAIEVLDDLNELADENEQLKQALQFLIDRYDCSVLQNNHCLAEKGYYKHNKQWCKK